MVKVNYSSNNSGGGWWLTDEHWYALEKAGWNVRWKKDEDTIFSTDDDGRWLGALATDASIEVNSIEEAIKSWEEVTGLDPSAEGCNCCGEPHNFSYEDEDGNTHYSRVVVTETSLEW